jgi:hypothetical protein
MGDLDVFIKSGHISTGDETYSRETFPPDKSFAASINQSLITSPMQSLRGHRTYNYELSCQRVFFNDVVKKN